MTINKTKTTNNPNKGNIRIFIDKIINTYAKEDELIQKVIESRFFLNGIRHTEYNDETPDDIQILDKLNNIERELAKIFA